jgi:hypothetical protein
MGRNQGLDPIGFYGFIGLDDDDIEEFLEPDDENRGFTLLVSMQSSYYILSWLKMPEELFTVAPLQAPAHSLVPAVKPKPKPWLAATAWRGPRQGPSGDACDLVGDHVIIMRMCLIGQLVGAAWADQ